MPMSVKSYRDLIVWQKAMDLVVESYRAATRLPKSEIYGLASQIQRAAVSVPANIAEGTDVITSESTFIIYRLLTVLLWNLNPFAPLTPAVLFADERTRRRIVAFGRGGKDADWSHPKPEKEHQLNRGA